jgi:site-specific DNA-methyltransferase (adenine-specific)
MHQNGSEPFVTVVRIDEGVRNHEFVTAGDVARLTGFGAVNHNDVAMGSGFVNHLGRHAASLRSCQNRQVTIGRIIQGDNLEILATLDDASFTLIYIDPPFNTGREQTRSKTTSVLAAADSTTALTGFKGKSYERTRSELMSYDDRFEDYWSFLEPRLREAWRLLADDGTLYLHLDYREAHYAKVMLDALFGRESFLNEIIWAYDYGAKSKKRWPAKHDTILVYVKNPVTYYFNSDEVDREPYMAPGLVTAEKAERGKLPTDVWWHTIVSPTGREKTGYPTQKPEGILRRIIHASSRQGDAVLDFFAGSGTTGAVAGALGRRFVLVDQNPEAIAVMQKRFASVDGVTFEQA